MLVVIADVHPRAQADLPLVKMFLANDALEQGGLAHPVVPDEGHPVPGPQVQLHVGKQHPVPVALLQLLAHEHILAGAAADVKAEVDGALLHGLFQALHFFQALFPALRGADGLLPVEGAVAGDDGLLPGNLLLLHFVGLHADLKALGALLHVPGVVAVVGFDGPQQQLRHVVAHMVHEIPVVADEQHGAPVAQQVFLQPGDGLQVQVVGGLVQQQHVRALQQ